MRALMGAEARAFLWYRLECVVRLRRGFTLDLADLLSPWRAARNSWARRGERSCRRVKEAGEKSHRNDRAIYYRADHMERRCCCGCSTGPLISVPAFCLCHCTKMWVSLVNTLNPRLREHIMTSCCVGSGLRTDKVGSGEGAMGRAVSHPRATQWFGCIFKYTKINMLFSTLAIYSRRNMMG